ncbi:22434_t:CDS:2, partial [Cetraspora pellucida]
AMLLQDSCDHEHDKDASLANKECKVMVTSESIPKCTVFDSWMNVETFLEEYRRRNEKYKPNKNQQRKQRITKTKKINCPWHINLSYREAETLISITIFVNEHNYNITFDTQEFRNKYCTLTEDALREVEIITKYECLSITAQWNLLKGCFPDLHFYNSDLNNAIQKFKRKETVNRITDALDLLNYLLANKMNDPR